MQTRRPLWLLATALAMTAGSLPAATPALPDLAGDWGGPQARLFMTADGGRLDLACASASIAGPLRATGNGGFSASGRYEEFGGGPTLADVAAATVPAHFTGKVVGDVMQLSVHADGAKAPQDLTLERGRRVKLLRCS